MLGLAAPTLVATVRHHDVFDFGRWQAVARLVLAALGLVYAAVAVVMWA